MCIRDRVCSAVAHVVALVPFIFIWLILRELLGGSVDSGTITRWAWWAVAVSYTHLDVYKRQVIGACTVDEVELAVSKLDTK